MGTCRDCDNFVAPDGCRFVIGQISPFGGCDLFEDGFAKVEGRLAKASVAKLDRDTFAYQEEPEGDDACGNCEHFNAEDTRCWLYDRLNHDEPRFFDLDAEVSPESYCTAHTPIGTVGKATGAEVDSAAAEAHPNPSDAQIAAGNYKKGHVRIHGLDISIENAKGSTRRGTGPDGTPWEAELPAHYGYVRRTVGADDEQVDIFIGPNPESAIAFVVDQLDELTGLFDEHKALIGFDALDEAMTAYRAAFSDGKDRAGAVHRLTVGGFKRWLKGGPLDEPIGTQVGKLAKMDDPADHEFKHPVPVSLPTADSITEARARHFAWSAINDGNNPKDWPLKRVSVDLLIATQDFADQDLIDQHAADVRNHEKHEPPMTVQLGRYYYVMDGQHRIEGGKLAGETEITVHYLATGVGKAAGRPFGRADIEPVDFNGNWLLKDWEDVPRDDHGRWEGGTASGGSVGLKESNGRAWSGKPNETKTPIGKAELGGLGERIAVEYLQKQKGLADAAPLHDTAAGNFPLDLVGDHQVFEVKTGLSSSGTPRWRITIGQPGKAETAWLKTASAEDKREWNRQKVQAAIDRKIAVVKQFSKDLGTKIKPQTIGVIVDPDRKVADVHIFQGFHANIGWNSPKVKSAYVGSFKYE